ncbi:glycerate kinase type-2 family protein [Stratiformator vulcanicus]|uniref:Hydroxypyruvate reductase n=1 Tax=Stratiformator vulcanicus TaxID=2527980 RepID=A0A517R2I3_9PLAN|nr:DUF4147 domain-containing protein [Stratiformator vulcanicus]QDT38090.1 Putative hydroxypyruvate reductase [Stratiformator vulcanicus]
MNNAQQLRKDAIAIWKAGVAAVDATKLVREQIEVSGDTVRVAGKSHAIHNIRRIVVVGAGKAGAGMARGVEDALGPELCESKLKGLVSVPADCVGPLEKIKLHAGRPAGVNEPRAEGVQGTQRILEIVGDLNDRDICVVLISGGGSALMPLPIDGITLEDKIAVTKLLAKSGAPIEELNTVRKHLSGIKGGKLAAAIGTPHATALIISDIVGNPLDLIASGPTVADRSTRAEALTILNRYAERNAIPDSVWEILEDDEAAPTPHAHQIINQIIGENGTSIAAAKAEAVRRGYEVDSLGSDNVGFARDEGVRLAQHAVQRRAAGPNSYCLLSGGEPVVKLADTDQPRKGGRNQELALAAAIELWDDGAENICVLSGGTDGEDGPTDAAGAFIDAGVIAEAKSQQLDPATFLEINNSYPFFENAGGLLKTGPTHTNVMDLRVVLVDPSS